MANRYGEAALMATRGPSARTNPVAQWDSAMETLYPTSPTARKKGCPRGAFLGLCEEGLVKGIPAVTTQHRRTTRPMRCVLQPY
jgi:hypothetical protein